MTTDPNHPDADRPMDLPPSLQQDLNRLYTTPPLPAAADAAIRAAIHQHFADRATARRFRRWLAPLAAAAAIAFAVVAYRFTPTRSAPAPSRVARNDPAPPTLPGGPTDRASTPSRTADLDANGRLNILDAFALARHLDHGLGARRTWDINNDGVVDRRDVDSIAQTAVSLKGGA